MKVSDPEIPSVEDPFEDPGSSPDPTLSVTQGLGEDRVVFSGNSRDINNNSSDTRWNRLLMNSILNHTDGLATTRRDDDLTFAVVPHRIDCFVLMGAKGDGQVVSVSM